jgi:hypothetical protein
LEYCCTCSGVECTIQYAEMNLFLCDISAWFQPARTGLKPVDDVISGQFVAIVLPAWSEW